MTEPAPRVVLRPLATPLRLGFLALELEGSHGRTILPLGRQDGADVREEPGVRPQL